MASLKNADTLPDITREIYRPRHFTQTLGLRPVSGVRQPVIRPELLASCIPREPFRPANHLQSSSLLIPVFHSANSLSIHSKCINNRPKVAVEQPHPPVGSVRKCTQSCRVARILRPELSKRENKPETCPLYLTLPTEAVTKWPQSVRLQYLRRSDMSSRPLVILQFTGVMGDWFCPDPWKQDCGLYMRKGWKEGLQKLTAIAQVALYIDLPRTRCFQLIALLKASHIHLDGIYKPRSHAFRCLQDYSQTITDFAITSTHLLTICPVNQEITGSEAGWDQIYTPTLSWRSRICVSGLPIPQNRVGIVTVVENPRAQETPIQHGFDDIVNTIKPVLDSGPSLKSAFTRLYKDKNALKTSELRYKDFPGTRESGIMKTRGRMRLVTLVTQGEPGDCYIRQDVETLDRPKSLC